MSESSTNRREFLSGSAATIAAATALGIASRSYAAGSASVKLGLIGCGGRGTGAAAQALTADPNAKLVAMGDVFSDALDNSYNRLRDAKTKGDDKRALQKQIEVDPEHRFVGLDSYKQVLESDIDAVLLATPPHFRPMHIKAAVEANKHIFAEKPVAVDAPGVRSVLESTEEARRRNLILVSGLCWRYETNMIQVMDRIHNGGLGEVSALEATRFGSGVWSKQRQPDETEMQWQIRNWYYYTWLSGDFNVEQFVHELDKMMWVMQDKPPVRCYGTGGRQTRTAPEYGHIYDHFYSVFEWDNGTKLYASTRHQRGCTNVRSDQVHGTEGRCTLTNFEITGKKPWSIPGAKTTDMHQLEQDAFLDAIANNKMINNGVYMAQSTMMAIIQRMTCYTGREVTWEQAMASKEALVPSSYDWNATPPPSEVAMPGQTKFV